MKATPKTRLPYSHKKKFHDRELFSLANIITPSYSIPCFETLNSNYTIQTIHNLNTFFTPRTRDNIRHPSLVIKTDKGNFYLESFDNCVQHNMFYMLLTVVIQCPVLTFQIIHYKSSKYKRLFYNIEKYLFKQEIYHGKQEDLYKLLKSLKKCFWVVYKYKSVSIQKQLEIDVKILKKYFNSYSSETKLSMIQIGTKMVIDFLILKDKNFFEYVLENLIFSEEKGKCLFFTFRDNIQRKGNNSGSNQALLFKDRLGTFVNYIRVTMRILEKVRKGEINAYDDKQDFGSLMFMKDFFSQ
jgi:hypothetical protein